jgi:quinol monooxygenase YgiN
MTTISSDAELVTFINVFTCDPIHQDELVDVLRRVTSEVVRHAPGFLSSRLHRGLDGTRVTMYAQWRSMADYEVMRKDPRPAAYLQRALAIAAFAPAAYEVVEDFVSSPAGPGA